MATPDELRVVVVGATGNVGTALMKKLAAEPRIKSLVGVARRLPSADLLHLDPKVSWDVADISSDALGVLQGADVVVHLAWMIQPSRDEPVMLGTNVTGTGRLLDAIAAFAVPAFVYASSVGTYAEGPKDRRTDESWSTAGVPTSVYSRHKARVESMLDRFEQEHPSVRVVRMRTSLVFQRSAASEIHRLFLGRLLPWHLPRALRVVPRMDRLVFQATHADDIADAYVQAVLRDVSGPFNIAAEPVLSPAVIAEALGGRAIPVPPSLARWAAQASYQLRLQPSEPGWLDMALQTPLMDT
ncbi:MAG TPA: NAD-dependent epimerase/dehydratase family protein, partial [Ilumatobacteraceae bacterium]